MPKTHLRALQVDHLGPIEHATLDFSEGLNVLTGETGAGKTLIVGALTLCVGESDDRGLRRSGALRASALFQSGDTEVSLSREGDDRERLRASIDGLVASAKALGETAAPLVVIYGQASSQRLRTPAEALRIIDAFGSVDSRTLADARHNLTSVATQLASLGGDGPARRREVEYTRFQLKEFADLAVTSETELDDVLERLTLLTALRDNQRSLADVSRQLDSDDGASATAQLRSASHVLDHIAPMADMSRRLKELSDEVADLAHTLAPDGDDVTSDDAEFAQLEARATQLHTLARKFGGSLGAALAQQREMSETLIRLESAEARALDLDETTRRLDVVIQQESERVRDERGAAAAAFVSAVTHQFARVALTSATLDAEVKGSDGSEVTFLFSPDRRRPSGPLHQMASGGELARVLLAMSLETLSDGVVAVFDEVDAGIGGSVAERIGECLLELAARQQVIVVTHLASIAAVADRHFVVHGASDATESATVVEVTGEDRVREIARMLAGESAPEEARALADQLLSRGGSRI